MRCRYATADVMPKEDVAAALRRRSLLTRPARGQPAAFTGCNARRAALPATVFKQHGQYKNWLYYTSEKAQ